ncbi:chemotaxis protein CheD [Geobacter sp. DSM 9736]|uniref:chemotaxis protein CheD n=1 Tax=Geobacter sp. DSM 9736 TaxID=1277350 RepID=UPI000B50E918|nr:chemotaxis protein CheD [Geobacter sp. DSM 9736]
MKIETLRRFKRITISPGEFYASGEPVMMTTLLGSCIAACLYDPVARIVGMNHFLLSNHRYARNMAVTLSEAGRYGVQAMEILINEMMRIGASRKRLCAKVFGGATILGSTQGAGNFACVGEVNCRFIHEFLENENIRLTAEDLGGEKGRVIHFSNGDFAVYVRKIKQIQSERVARRDRECWLKAIESQELTMPDVDLWQ